MTVEWRPERVVRLWGMLVLLFIAGCIVALVIPHDPGIPYPWSGSPVEHPVGNAILNAIGLLILMGTALLAVVSVLALGRRGLLRRPSNEAPTER